MALKITEREKNAILNSLSAGVVPRIGLQHIQVGRKAEIAALLEDLKQVEGGGAAIRFVVGRFGSGKSFFLNAIQTVALERRFVVIRADITTERRLQSTGGEARALYAELMRNLATKGKPDGGALSNLVEKFIADIEAEVQNKGGDAEAVVAKLLERSTPLKELVHGYDFIKVLEHYYRAYLAHDDAKRDAALRWLRAEYTTKTEAREDLGVRAIIDDDSIYNFLKLFGRFTRIAGSSGLLVLLDELVVLSHRLNNKIARNNNYEAILTILNDCLQGSVEGLCFLFAATDECLTDTRRGLFSYEALATRLAPSRFAGNLTDLKGPVIKLPSLTPEECYVLLHNIRHVHAGGHPEKNALPDEAIEGYLKSCEKRMGAAYFQTPRDTVKDWIGLLNVVSQNPGADWKTLVGALKTTQVQQVDPSVTAAEQDGDGDDLSSFKM